MAMYIRVKRGKTTDFIQCDPSETTSDIKQKLQGLIDQPSSNQRLTLVENDAIVALSLRKVYADGSICLDILQNQWSPIYDVAAILTSIQGEFQLGCKVSFRLQRFAKKDFILCFVLVRRWLKRIGWTLMQAEKIDDGCGFS